MSAEILQEFVTKLGYHVDEASSKRFSASLGKVGNLVGGVGKQVAGLAVTAEAAVREFAVQMERVGYSARLSDATAQSIMGAGAAVEKFGLQASQIQGITAAFADLIRHSPGVEAQLNQLGVALDPDKIKEFWSLMERLETMPENIALQYAQAFQIPSDAYHLMRGHVAEIRSNMDAIADKSAILGYNTEEAAKNGQEYSNHVRNIKNNLDLISGKVLNVGMEAALPIMRDVDNTIGSIFVTKKMIAEIDKKGTEEINRQRNEESAYEKEVRRLKEAQKPSVKNEPADKKAFLSDLEKRYKLPGGLLYGMEQQESGGGKALRSAAGAQGPFQLMPDTQKKYGVTNPDDYVQAANASAQMMQELLNKYKGRMDLAIAAYNAGPGRVDKYLAGKSGLPEETRGYVPGVVSKAPAGSEVARMAPTIIMNFHGPADPAKVKSAAEEGVKRGMANQKSTARTMTGSGPSGANVS